jgi:hypothetical protein
VPSRHLLCLAFVIACGDKTGPAVTPVGGALPASELQVGSYVVYRFSGRFSSAPVTLREEVVSKDAGRVSIAVHATRGHEERSWLQVGPDTADARWNNTVDEIWVTRDGAKERLPNPDNATLVRLYDWVLVGAEGEATGRETASCEQAIATSRVTCSCERATHPGRKTLRSEESRCPAFAWQRGPARWSTPEGDVFWQAEVVETK